MCGDTTPTRSAELVQPAEAAYVGAARHFTSELLGLWGLAAEDRIAAELIVDELAANAARHGRAQMSVRLCLRDDGLVITVTDSGEARHHDGASAEATPPDEHGRGLEIVRRLAGSTCIHDDERGRRVVTTRRLAPLQRPVAGVTSPAS
ncbi:ATP-binding protein [Streptomyces sp. ME01-24h]|jgi:anti-sigma regulatory factor (Ser/Thr protein kinase)|nr:ATP-binding protein [Streptomyces sp. ME19-03-3]MDX3234292.1 ATP-binding protein [Streptomyces sp. ME03-5709C]MDX3357954.1 ATP-binding protein [Streptomyces sp. ME01-24h]